MLSDALRDPDECRYLECTLESSLTAIGHLRLSEYAS
jgi:hypothetical protein